MAGKHLNTEYANADVEHVPSRGNPSTMCLTPLAHANCDEKYLTPADPKGKTSFEQITYLLECLAFDARKITFDQTGRNNLSGSQFVTRVEINHGC